MALPTFNTKSPTIKRILKEASELSAHPDPSLHAAPLESNLFEWHFTVRGPPGTPYSVGAYHGRIILPPTYPLRPPSFRFLTPSGRFEVNREICLSISGHHEETWQPAWGIRTALCALRAFMEGDAKGQVGGMEMPQKERLRLAEESRLWRCGSCGERENETILKDEGGDGESGSTELPKDLSFGFKDELEKVKSNRRGNDLEDTLVDQAQPSMSNQDASDTREVPSEVHVPASDVLPTAAPTNSGSSMSPPSPRPQLVHPRPNQARGSSNWVDKAITGVATALAVMVIKKIVL